MKASARDRKFTQDRRTAVRFFSIAAWDKEQDYLRRQHAEGWKLERVGFLGVYRFARCTPEDVVYQLDYNPDGLAHKDEYVRMFEDCGWEYLQDYVGYSYFRKPVSQMDGRDEQNLLRRRVARCADPPGVCGTYGAGAPRHPVARGPLRRGERCLPDSVVVGPTGPFRAACSYIWGGARAVFGALSAPAPRSRVLIRATLRVVAATSSRWSPCVLLLPAS